VYWLLGSKSQLSIENKLLLYKAILKPIWAYGVQLWRTVSNSNIGMLHNVPYVGDEIKRLSQRYADRMEKHSNILATNLVKKVKTTRRLKRK